MIQADEKNINSNTDVATKNKTFFEEHIKHPYIAKMWK